MSSFQEQLDKLSGKRNHIREQIAVGNEKLVLKRQEEAEITEAQLIVQHVAAQTQSELKFHVETLITSALSSVFANPYEFEVEFDTKSNRTAATCWFKRGENRIPPVKSSGGGAIDIAALAARVTMWALGKTRSLMILDEPMKFLSTDLRDRGGEFLKYISSKLGIQLVMVTHIQSLCQSADVVYSCSMSDGKSTLARTK